MNSTNKEQLDTSDANASHKTGTKLHFFGALFLEKDFFHLHRPAWETPSFDAIGGHLLDLFYEYAMEVTSDATPEDGGVAIEIDGATNVLSQSMRNVILYAPLPLFCRTSQIRYQARNTINVVHKLKNVMDRVEAKVGFRPQYFVSESCNDMCDVRRVLVSDGVARWAYGCMAHALNNFWEDLGSEKCSSVMKEGLFVANTVRGKNIVRMLFEDFPREKIGKV